MTTTDFLKPQLRLLFAQFGRRAVLEALAGLTDATPDQIQEEIARLEATRYAKSVKRDKSLDELIGELPIISEEVRDFVRRLGVLFESKQFLPNLRDAEEFLRRNTGVTKKYKNRRESLKAVLKTLSEMEVNELESLVAQNRNASGQSDYAILANQLMGKKH